MPPSNETASEFANHPSTISIELVNWTIKRKRMSLGEIKASAHEFLDTVRDNETDPRQLAERMARPRETGNQALHISALITDTNVNSEMAMWARRPENRDTVRAILDKALLADYAHCQSEADYANIKGDTLDAGSLQPMANKMLDVRSALLAKVPAKVAGARNV